MEFNILELAPIISDTKQCITFLRGRNLLLEDYICCGQPSAKVVDPNLTDKEIFQCNLCRQRHSIRTGSFWSKSKLELTVLVTILYFFANCSTVTNVRNFLHRKASKTTIIQWFNYFRDVMSTYLSNHPAMFQNCTVHIDETFIGGKRKYNRGRIPNVRPRWLLGIVSKTDHKIAIEFVTKRDFINVIPFITRHVSPGCTINTDGAKVYTALDRMNYNHNVCIHKEHFVNPLTGEHSNWIENVWGNLKIKLKSIRGSQNRMLDGHLDEYVYRYNRKSEGSIFDLLMQDIAIYYPI